MNRPDLDYPDPDLTDGVVVLRRWAADDVDCLYEASQDPMIRQGTTVPDVFTPERGRAFIERQWDRQTNAEGLSLAIADAGDNRARGLVVLMHRKTPGTVGIGYWVVPSARRQRRATRAVRLLASWATMVRGLSRLEAFTEPNHVGSQRVLAGSGFHREGVLRSYFLIGERRADAVMYSLLPTDY
jgi:RimJ/RimL family protein N-acetyltransferase